MAPKPERPRRPTLSRLVSEKVGPMPANRTKIRRLDRTTRLGTAALLALTLTACKTDPAPAPSSTAQQHALQFLSHEVPAWSRDNQCFSCHNNGDGARALMIAPPDRNTAVALADTLEWLSAPDRWDDNKGDPSASDKQLADLQFAFAVLTAFEHGWLKDRTILSRAAARLLPHQSIDGAWHVEPQNPVGSPVTYGTTLATYVGWKILRALDNEKILTARAKAEQWLARARFTNIPAAASLLIFSTEIGDARRKTESADYLITHQLPNGGWGPYPQAPAEVYDTALALIALKTANAGEELLQKGESFLRREQRPDGSWPATTRPTGGESYAQQLSTTAWAALALQSVDQNATPGQKFPE